MTNSENKTWVNEWMDRKMHHYLFWIPYFLFWLFVSGGVSIDNIIINLIFLLCAMIPTYINIYYLMPKLLEQKKWLLYLFGFVFNILTFAVLLGIGLYLYFDFRSISETGFFEFPQIMGPTLGSVMTTVIGLMILKLIKNGYDAQQRNQKLQTKSLENELKFLRSQLNPHFLFNALNNIYFLIKKNPDQAADSLAQFSEMLRYQMYECNGPEISLNKELEFIQNYIELAHLSKKEQTILTLNLPKETNGTTISPLLLISFVENAFKHVSENHAGRNFINVDLSVDLNEIDFRVVNSSDPDEKSKDSTAGIGLVNLERRLSLLYPNKYKLNYNEEYGEFDAHLKIELA